METKKNRHERHDKSIFLVLVPHREARAKIRKEFDSLTKSGFKGAYSFPFVSPLVSLKRPLITDELKAAARSLREATGKEKINITELSLTAFPNKNEMLLFGPKLDIDTAAFAEKLAANQILKTVIEKNMFLSPAIIGACLLPENNKQQLLASIKHSASDLCEIFGFRAAAVANMYWQPLRVNAELCFKWKIGKLAWLPKEAKASKVNS